MALLHRLTARLAFMGRFACFQLAKYVQCLCREFLSQYNYVTSRGYLNRFHLLPPVILLLVHIRAIRSVLNRTVVFFLQLNDTYAYASSYFNFMLCSRLHTVGGW
jgi:hypothetical protein